MDNSFVEGFAIGDTVVHPQHGVGQVIGLSEKQFEPNKPRMYYEITTKDATLWVPVENSVSGLRKLGLLSDLEDCSHILQSTPFTLIPGRELISNLSIRIKDGKIGSHCEVVRDVTAFGWHKPLYGPLAEFQRAIFNVICQEWACVKGVSQVDASQEINNLLKKGRLANEISSN